MPADRASGARGTLRSKPTPVRWVSCCTKAVSCIVAHGTLAVVVCSQAATITVNTTSDELNVDGDCSLREAIRAANSNAVVDACAGGTGLDTIVFDPVVTPGTFLLEIPGSDDAAATGDLDITEAVTISGSGPAETIIDAGGIDRVLHILPVQGAVTIRNLTIRNGQSPFGNDAGGIRSATSVTLAISNCHVIGNSEKGITAGTDLTVSDSIVSGNHDGAEGVGITMYGGVLTVTRTTISENDGDWGALILVDAAATISESTISGNRSASLGGGLFLFGSASATVVNSTIGGNRAGSVGGGVYMDPTAALTVINSTISGNESEFAPGGGIFGEAGACAVLQNSILAGNSAPQSPDCTCVTSLGHNLIGDLADCDIVLQTGDLTGDPRLSVFAAEEGVPGSGHFSPRCDSRAIDAADDSSCPQTDQLGNPRIVDGDGDGEAACDIGAIEVQGATCTLECGNGVVDPAEECDDGAANGTLGSCCTSTCDFEAGGTACRLAAGECDVAETCSGSDGKCPTDGVQVGGVGCTDDGNACTDDICDGVGAACTHPANWASCDDRDGCTTDDACAAGVCMGGPPPDCDDRDVCTDDFCDRETGCVHANNTAPCDDGDACTTGDACADGTCVGGTGPDCDDQNLCTDDSCDPEGGCRHANNSLPCDDGNACTTVDKCTDGECVGTGADCDDENPCTDDGCDPKGGCTHANNSLPCDDGDACTTGDACSDGTCVGGPGTSCDDENPCTDDGCDPEGGCTHVNNSAPCDDGNACTEHSRCTDGECVGDPTSECDDQNPCTDDGCNPEGGCTHDNNSVPCDDGDPCTRTDVCGAGVCTGSNPDPACGVAAGRMTGGGRVSGPERVTNGFELHCNPAEGPNSLEVNWAKGKRFHLDVLTSASCSDGPGIDERPPVAGFDTHVGSGTGRYRGASGATATWTFTDAGEPGGNDSATIVITDADGRVVLSIHGNLAQGNHQAHAGQKPPGRRAGPPSGVGHGRRWPPTRR